MELRSERRNLLHQIVGQPLPRNLGESRNVVDRLFGIELGALSARPIENVDDVAFEVDQTQFEHGEQTHGARANNHDIGDDFISAH